MIDKKTCLLSGNFAFDIVKVREYHDGFVVGKKNKFEEKVVVESIGNTCGNVSCILSYLGVQTFPIGHFDLSDYGLRMKEDLQRYGADIRFVDNSVNGGTTLFDCTHKVNKAGEKTFSIRVTSPSSRFPKRKFIRLRDEAPEFMEKLDFVPDVYFFDASEAGLRYIAEQLHEKGTLIYFEPERDNEQKKLLKGVELSDIVKFSHERISDISFTEQYKDKLFIRTLGEEGLEFNLCGKGWIKLDSIPNDNVVDTEGAGDWITSQFIACLCEKDCLSISKMTESLIKECLNKAIETASRSVSFIGSKGMIALK